MSQPLTELDLDAAYAAGVAETSEELLPFLGVGRVKFPRGGSQLEGMIIYERELLDYLREMQRSAEQLRREEEFDADSHPIAARRRRERVDAAQGSNRLTTCVRRTVARFQADAEDEEAKANFADLIQRRHRAEQHAADVAAELDAVRARLDAELDRATAYAEVRPGLRRETDILPHAAPYSRQEFFDADRAAREHAIEPGANAPGGYNYGDRWTWEHPDRPWERTQWSLFWLDNGEIYAVDVTYGSGLDARPARDPDEEILLLGRIPRPAPRALDFLADLQDRIGRNERNTLLVVAKAVADQQRERERQATPGEQDD